jgi:hypothetical protein
MHRFACVQNVLMKSHQDYAHLYANTIVELSALHVLDLTLFEKHRIAVKSQASRQKIPELRRFTV